MASIKIIILNVKDGDAIIVYLQKDNNHFVMLIDGGHQSDYPLVIEQLTPILETANKKAPDLILCTHYDMDHIGGLKGIIQKYKTDIAQILIHRTSEILNIPSLLSNTEDTQDSFFPFDDDIVIGDDIDFMDIEKDENINIVLEGINQEIELLELIDKIKIPCSEPCVDNFIFKDWEEIKIIAPTIDYYQKLFPKHFDSREFLIEEAVELKEEIENGEPEKDKSIDPCEFLDSLKKSKVTSPNLNSAIIKIDINGKTFLFAGDAGIDSFYNIPNYKEEIANIFWLKVPHHGSRNNITCDLIKLMSPKVSAISGNKYIDDSVVKCLKSIGSSVDITRDLKRDLIYTF